MDNAELNRLYWRSRRGMSELELHLLGFLADSFPTLDANQQRAYAELLEFEDWSIYDWLQGRGEPEQPHIAEIIGLIRSSGPLGK